MESIKLLNELERLPKTETISGDDFKFQAFNTLVSLKNRDAMLEAGIQSGLAGYQLLELRNVPDGLSKSFELQYPRLFENGTSLYSKYVELEKSGEQSVQGLINGLKGKYFEQHVHEQLSDQYPEYKFQIAELSNQPIWDIKGIHNGTGEELFIQVKMMNSKRVHDLKEIMKENPDIYYATSTEIREKILEHSPELMEQFIPIDISEYTFTQEVEEGLALLAGNYGLDLPDKVFELVDFAPEIMLGVRTLFDIAQVQRDFGQVKTTDKSRLAAAKVLILISKFGVNVFFVKIGSLAGFAVHPVAGVAGGFTGHIVARKINKEIAPHSLKLAYQLLQLSETDIFYFKNFERINRLLLEYYALKSQSNLIAKDH
ncbi:DUF456 domain-containing protein [Exiguobacterium sp. s183]|uniref:DUF456 domain-containing protein n=1 Tax=Exiguobacterium sp. s183 TaxID=2751262 RepID=UPI001BE89E9C|nr:DUF456 domain-containing protein [Exiguobacterium sp. s183]